MNRSVIDFADWLEFGIESDLPVAERRGVVESAMHSLLRSLLLKKEKIITVIIDKKIN